MVEAGIRAGALPPGFTALDAKRYIQIFQVQLRAMLEYRAEPSDLTVHLFAALEDEGEADGAWGWDRVARGGVRRIDVAGDDSSLMRSPRVDDFARLVYDAVGEAEGRARTAETAGSQHP